MSETTQPGASDGAPVVDVATPTDAGQSVAPAENAAPAPAEDDDAQDTDAGDTGNRPRGTGRRVSELLQDRAYERQARAQAEARAEALAERLAQIQQGGGQQANKTPSGPAALPPDLAQYVGSPPDASQFPAGEFDPAYAEERALYRFKTEQAKAHVQQRETQARQQQQQAATQVQQRIGTMFEEGRKAYADFDAVVTADNVPLPQHVVRELADLDAPADVAYWLAKNPQDAARIAKLDGRGVVRELARIEGRLAASVAPPPQPTSAPPPPRTVRGAGSSHSPSLDAMSPADFAKKFYG